MGTSRLFRNTPAFLAILLLGSGSLALAASLASTLMIIGHRGMGKASAPIPENSLSAIREALREGVTAVEFDVQLSSDGEVVLAHDEDLQRITGVRKCVSQSSLSDLQKLPLMDGLGHAHPAERLSRLSEVLSFLKSMDDPAKPFIADIHVKVYDGLRGDLPTHFINHCPKTDWLKLTTRTLAEVSAAGMSQRVIYTSFDSRVLDEIRTRQPAARVGILSMLMPRESIEVARQKGYNYVALGNPVLEQEEIAEAHEAGVGVLLWFPNSEEQDWDQCAAGLVDGIITDHVSRTLKIAQPEARPCRIRNQDDVVPDFGNSW